MAPPDGGLHVTLTVVGDIWSSDVTLGLPATGETCEIEHELTLHNTIFIVIVHVISGVRSHINTVHLLLGWMFIVP